MLVLLSPSKAMDFATPVTLDSSSTPQFEQQTATLIDTMRAHTSKDLQSLMSLSQNLGDLNARRYAEFFAPATPCRQAILAFVGDTYKDIPLTHYAPQDFAHAQARLRILSGLYGLLRPLDLISPYRLEMGTKLGTPKGSSLYAFWGTTIRDAITHDLAQGGWDTVLNLASKEYAKAARLGELKGVRVIDPVFKDYSNGAYKVVSFWAKRARGMMADFVVREGIKDPDGLQGFERAGYLADATTSSPDAPVFLRRKERV